MSGKTVLFFGGLCLFTYPGLTSWSHAVGISNAICMLLGQMWYTTYWTIRKDEGIDHFLAKISRHPLRSMFYPGVWLAAAAVYYVAFTALFAIAYGNETNDLARGYNLAATIWHGWILILLLSASYCACAEGRKEYAYQRV